MVPSSPGFRGNPACGSSPPLETAIDRQGGDQYMSIVRNIKINGQRNEHLNNEIHITHKCKHKYQFNTKSNTDTIRNEHNGRRNEGEH